MYPAVRDPVPRDLSWRMTDSVVKDFFWLQVPQPAKQQELIAECRDNHFRLTANGGLAEATVFFDSRLIDFARPITIEISGVTTARKVVPSLRTLCTCLQRRGDPEFAFDGSFTLRQPGTAGKLEVVKGP